MNNTGIRYPERFNPANIKARNEILPSASSVHSTTPKLYAVIYISITSAFHLYFQYSDVCL
jgi:hypothetical protein